ncbi:MAG: metalloendopeptidase-related protein [Symbiobacteriaceae bacterium]|jgi:murein DD-endopeptidase MepM/ murein hydrolase activator NlpD|nr:metalloendopeptidase-related protein [Symbiobacteriaceae bacterium]
MKFMEGTIVATKRQRKMTTITIAALLVLTGLVAWGYPAAGRFQAWVAGHLGVGPTADTAESVAELDREVQEIGRLIRERQAGAAGQADQAGQAAWPVPGWLEPTSAFGSRVHPILNVPKLHTGVDIGANEGAPVAATLDGRVIIVEALPAYGQIVVIDHGGKLSSVYAHLSAVLVREGDWVERGARIGKVGSTGAVTGPHLHFEVRQDGEPVDPGALIGAG